MNYWIHVSHPQSSSFYIREGDYCLISIKVIIKNCQWSVNNFFHSTTLYVASSMFRCSVWVHFFLVVTLCKDIWPYVIIHINSACTDLSNTCFTSKTKSFNSLPGLLSSCSFLGHLSELSWSNRASLLHHLRKKGVRLLQERERLIKFLHPSIAHHLEWWIILCMNSSI